MDKLFDLRFVIGFFFLIIGGLLSAYGMISTGRGHTAINWGCGLLFMVFATVMIAWAVKKNKPGSPES
jgi:quinol-cytochrome oxidoreductase complex cytochrome b subunit